MASLKNYIDSLAPDAKKRYKEKIALVDDIDPYATNKKTWSTAVADYPTITYPDIVNYLLLTKSAYTNDELKNFKSLEAYNQFLSGWVKDISLVHASKKNIIVHARVMHSQRMNDTALHPWIISKNNGTVLAGHCNCMAGLGESCTHVAALLFAIEASVRIRQSKTCTEEKAYWMLPSSLNKVSYSPVSEIDFTAPQSKRRHLDSKIQGKVVQEANIQPSTKVPIPPPTKNDIDAFYKCISQNKHKPAILALVEPYSDDFVPSSLKKSIPKALTEIYDEKTCSLSYEELILHCKSIDLSLTEEQIINVEKETRQQSNCRLWFQLKAGRVSSSTMKSCCRTKIDKPSMSLIKKICYPEAYRFSTEATRWGCTHEKVACEAYKNIMKNKHTNFTVKDSGFIMSKEYPFMGASPDGMTECSCCGIGCLEIKCPLCPHDSVVDIGLEKKGFCLIKCDGGTNMQLSRKHSYYYQVQSQVNLCKEASFVDFVLWTEKSIFIERILPDREMWEQTVHEACSFFYKCILPELVGKYFTRKHAT